MDDLQRSAKVARARASNAQASLKAEQLEKEVAILADAATTAEEEAARHALGVRRRFGKKRSTKILTLWAVADCLEGGV